LKYTKVLIVLNNIISSARFAFKQDQKLGLKKRTAVHVLIVSISN